MNVPKLIAALGIASAIGIAAPAGVAAASQSHHAAHNPKKPAHKKPAHKSAAGIGSTIVVLNEEKQYEAVKLVAVTDPAQPTTSQFTTPPAGDRFVSVTIQIHNRSKTTDTNDANDNTSVVGTNRQDYSPTFATLTGCTNFDNGQYTLAGGATEVGCVAFAIPNGVTVAEVQYNPNAGFSTNDAVWKVSQ